MKAMTFGVIAITSTMAFACTVTETTTTTTEPGSPETSKPADPDGWHSKVSRSKPGTTSGVAALGGGKTKGGTGPNRVLSGGGKCGLSTGDTTCDTCLDTSCCAENTACVNDTDCSALIACGNACTSDTCISNCMSSHPTGAAILDKLFTCMEGSCTTACGGGPSGPPSTSACGFATGAATCDTCLDTNCCGDANACLNDTDCIALLDCASLCSDSKCAAACETAHPTGAAKMNTLSTCATTKCGTTCNAPGPGPSPTSCGLTSGVANCDTCLDASCCAQTTACIGDADCTALVDCYNTCTTATCAVACDTAHPTGLTKLNSVFTCVQTSCGATCGF